MTFSFEKIMLRVFVAFFGWLTALVFLAVVGWFDVGAVTAISIVAVVALVLSLLWPRRKLSLTRREVLMLIIILAVCTLIGLWHHDLPLGRDPVSYFTAGVNIADSGSLSFTDQIARPFHGLAELSPDTFTSQFLPGYTVYLGFFYMLGGLTGLWWANIPLLFLSLVAIYLVAKRLSTFSGGLIAVFLTGTFYAVIWFERRWTSENLFMLAIWSAISLFVVGVRRRKLSLILLGSFPAMFSLLIRGEGILYVTAYGLAALVVLIWWRKDFKLISADWALLALPLVTYITFQMYVTTYGGGYVFGQGQTIFSAISGMLGRTQTLAALAIVGALVFILVLVRYLAKYKWRSRIGFWKLYWAILGISIIVGEIIFWFWVERDIPILSWDFYRSQFVLEIFHHYLLTIFFVIVFFGFYQKAYQKLTYLVILIGLPSVVFILDPYIALDHPWFMRRFVAVFIPLVFLLAAITLSRLCRHRITLVLCAIILIVINLAVSGPILFYQEKDGIEPQLEVLANRFDDSDIVLMTPGWKWHQWAYYLHFLYGVDVLPSLEGYEDQEELLALLEKYDEVYVLSDTFFAHHPLYKDNQLDLVDKFTLEYPELKKPMWGLAAILEETDGQVDVLSVHRLQQGLPAHEITEKEVSLQLFKVK